MHVQAAGPNSWATFVPLVIIALVVLLRLRRVGKHRPLRLEQLWIIPALILAGTIAAFVSQPPSPAGWAVCVVGLAVGAALGWKRGTMMHIHVDPETHRLNQMQSPAALLFFVAIVVVRYGAKALVESGVLPMHVNPMLVSDVLLTFALGMFTVMRIEMYLRARRLLAEARAVVGVA
jgi:hypothetical protein